MEKKIKFGVSQVSNTTPLVFKYIFRIYTFLSGLWAILSPNFSGINEHIVSEINKWLLIGVPIMHYLIKFFGWDYSDKPDTDMP